MKCRNSHRFFATTILALLILLLASAPTWSQEKIQPTRQFLDNGLEVILVEMHKSPIIISQLYYKVGSRNEQNSKTGISHIVEHLMFKGTKKFPTGQISKIIRRNSGVFNAFTSNDITCYYEQMPKNKIEIAFEIESDRMMNSVFDPDEFKDEIEVIKEERRMRIENNPESIFGEEMLATFYMSHPYHWPIIGWMNDLNNITRDDAYAYYKTHYTPNNAVLVVVGDFKQKEMFKMIRKYFGKIPRGPEVPELAVIEPEIRTMKSVHKTSPELAMPKYRAYFQGMDYANKDYPAMRIAMNILSRGRTSRLYPELVRSRLCSSFRLGQQRFIDMGPITFTADLYPETSVDTVKQIFFREVKRMQEEPVTPRELRKVKNSYKINSVYNNMKVSEVASQLGSAEVKAHDINYFDKLYSEIDAVTAEDVRNVMNKYFKVDYYVEGSLFPDSLKKEVSGKDIIAASNADDLEEELKSETDDKDAEEEAIPFNPDDFIRPNPIAPAVQQFKLSNGIKVVFYEDHTFPIIEMVGTIQIGNAVLNGEKPGLGAMTADLMAQGSEKFPYKTLIDTLSMLSTSVQFAGGDENIIFAWGTIKDNWDEISDIGSDILQHPLFPEDELQRLQKRRIAVLKDTEMRTGWKLGKYMVDTIFRDHPYQRLMSAESIAKIDINDVRKFYQTYYRPELATLVITGDVSQADLKSSLEKYLGSWKNATEYTPVPYPEQKDITAMDVKVYTNYEDKQVSVRIAHQMPSKNNPDADKLEVANHILGGSSLTSRLGINIRDKQGLTYGIGSRLKMRNEGGWYFIESQTAPKNLGRLLVSTLYEMQRMRTEKVTKNELNDAKRFYLGTLPMIIETPTDVQRVLLREVEAGQPLDDFDNYADRLIKISREDVLEVSQKYYHPDKCIIIVGGPITPDEVRQQFNDALKQMDLNVPVTLDNVEIGVIE